MRKVLLLTIAVMCVSSLAYGQAGHGSIDIFSDAGFTSCNITTPAAEAYTVYIAQTNVTNGTTACAFSIDKPAALLNLGETVPDPFLKIGNSDDGVSISYTLCLTGTFLVMSITYFGAAGTCDLMTVVGDPTSTTGEVEFIDCDAIRSSIPQAGQARLNPDGTCTCDVPVQETTWGGIKALYDN